MRPVLVVLALLVLATPAAAQDELAGPAGTSDDKVLVIGTDGTRFDKVGEEIAAGGAPNLAQLGIQGFSVPALLDYGPPTDLTLSEVGWSTIATGVWPDKHGVHGFAFNMDPGQATKNGYPDFLSAIEANRPKLSTFLASDWANIGLHQNGGPIFGDAIDTRFTLAAADTIASYDDGDGKVTTAAARYLRHGDPDAGFVYLGVVDETAHAVGSATPDYLDAIHRTDTRIGRLLAAIRARKTYRQERWMVIVTTDHGQQDLNYGSIVSHGGGSDLERTSFLTAAGFGVKHDPVSVDPRVVDIAPTVLTRLGIPYSGLDGHPLARRAAIPRPIVVRKRHRVVVRAPMGSPNLRRVLIQPASRRRRVTRAPRRFVVRFAGRKALQGVVVIDADGRRTVT